MKTVDIVCPIYRNFDELQRLYFGLEKQVDINIANYVFPLTISKDKEMDEKIKVFFKEHNIIYFEVSKDEFSHSLTREKAIKEYCKSDVVVLCSQDAIFFEEHALSNIANAIDDEVVYAYGKQICTNKTIERYIRQKNYPNESNIVSKDDIEKMQLMAFFASDAFSALNRNVFIKIN